MAGQSLLKRKGIVISPKVYFVDAMNGMAQGLFASLLMGTILKTLATYIGMLKGKVFVDFALFLLSISTAASAVQGAAIGVGIAVALKSPVLVTACAAVVGHFANSHCGAGPLGVFVAVIAACELGKLVSKGNEGRHFGHSSYHAYNRLCRSSPDLSLYRSRHEMAGKFP